MSIEVRGIVKRFGPYTAVNEVSLTIPDGSLVALLGPSGSGKTTLLRIIAGLESVDAGRVYLNGADVTDVHARRRGVGFVFQHYALFRHMTVQENIGFSLKVRGRPRAEIDATVEELLRLVRLQGFGRRYPSQLSGGQRQRVALARALAARPSLLLLDEPFGALDANVRQELRKWLRQLHDELGVTSVFVTHDQEEALEVADRVVVMNHGRVEQEGKPEEVYEHPASPFVIRFLGQVNIFHGRVEEGRVQLGGLVVEHPHDPADHGRPAAGYVRPFEIEVGRRVDGDLGSAPEGGCAARVRQVRPAGPIVRLELTTEACGAPVLAEVSRERFAELRLKEGEPVHFWPKRVRVFAGDRGPGAPTRLALRRPPTTPEEARIAELLPEGSVPAALLAERLADLEYQDMLGREHAWASELGRVNEADLEHHDTLGREGSGREVVLWSRSTFLSGAHRRLAALTGDLLEEVDRAG